MKVLVLFSLGNRNYSHHFHPCVFQKKVCLVTYSFNPPWGKDDSETFVSFPYGPPFSESVHGPYVSRIPRLAGWRQGTCAIMNGHHSCSGGLVYSFKLLPVTEEDGYIFHGLFWQAKSIYFPYCYFSHGFYTGHSLGGYYWIFNTPEAPGFKYSCTYSLMLRLSAENTMLKLTMTYCEFIISDK